MYVKNKLSYEMYEGLFFCNNLGELSVYINRGVLTISKMRMVKPLAE